MTNFKDYVNQASEDIIEAGVTVEKKVTTQDYIAYELNCLTESLYKLIDAIEKKGE